LQQAAQGTGVIEELMIASHLRDSLSSFPERRGIGFAGAYIGSIVATLAALHPLEYVAMNALAGGTRGAYGNFELDYWSAAATEALRRLEHRLDYDLSILPAETAPSILICIGSREGSVHSIPETAVDRRDRSGQG
jgi:hypothetical protein